MKKLYNLIIHKILKPTFTKLIIKLTDSEEKKRLLSNVFSLSLLQGINYILPLITLPYLVRILGVEYFGLLAFATAVIMYFQTITDYGFNITATREISLHRDNREKITQIFSAVLTIKFLLMVLCALVLSILILCFQRFSKDREIYYLTFGLVIGQLLFPVWFFQGMERMKYITYLNIIAKSIFTIAVFVFVNKQSDYYLVPILTSFGFIVVGIWSIIIIKRQFQINFRFQSKNTVFYYFKEGWYIFLSNIAISLYTMTTTVLLGILTNNTIVGYYSVVDRLLGALKGLISPFSQALYPYINRIAAVSKRQALLLVRKLTLFAGILMFVLSLFLFIFAKEIIEIVFGLTSNHSNIVMKILAFVPFLAALDTMFGTLTMLVFNRNKPFSNIIVSAGVLSIILAVILIPIYQHIGAAISVLFAEIFITIRLILYTQKNGLSIFVK